MEELKYNGYPALKLGQEIDFKQLNFRIQIQFDEMQKHRLFRLDVTGEEIWDHYINGFRPEQNPVFRDPNSSEANCNNDKNFIRRYGNIVAITEDLEIMSLFDIDVVGSKYENAIASVKEFISSKKVGSVFFETYDNLDKLLPYEKAYPDQSTFLLGHIKTLKKYTKEEVEKFGVVNEDQIYTFDHFHILLYNSFVDFTKKSVEAIEANFRDSKNVFERALEEIPLDTFNLVVDLINQNSILDGATHIDKVKMMAKYKKNYNDVDPSKRDIWCWYHSYRLPIAKFKNELMGVLCTDLATGVELNKACELWNKRVDPANYMKATAPITKRQIEEARQFVTDNGYESSFNRRLATIDDIEISEILHSNSGSEEIKSMSIFDTLKPTKATIHKRSEFDKIEEVHIDKFMKDILPSISSMELLLQNNHIGNMVSMTTADDRNSKPIFKWPNNYSWSYNGNLAGKSQIKDAVKSRGGNVDGVLRVSLSFPNTTDDYDLHMYEPDGNQIFFSNLRKIHPSSGMLDLDAQGRDGWQKPEERVENIIYTDINKMPKGKYSVAVNNYSDRKLHTSFTIEIECDGEVTLLELSKGSKNNRMVVATINFDGNQFTIQPDTDMKILSSSTISREIYGLTTNMFHKVKLFCLSPNHWNGNKIGNKHYMFMLDKCKSNDLVRGFHNENLLPELLEHRKVMEVLGNNCMIDPSADKQLSGVGFNATMKEEVVLKLSGSHKRIIKLKF